MAKFFLFLDANKFEIAGLTPMPFQGINAEPDVEKCLLQIFVNDCADAGEDKKILLHKVQYLTERFSDTTMTIDEAKDRIKARSSELSAVHAAYANMPNLNW